MSDLAGRTAVVTGTAHGIGAAIEQALAGQGATVHGVDKDLADLTSPDAVREFFAAAGAVDILVNNAGGVCGQVGRPLEEVTDQDWRQVVDANLTSTFLCTRAVVPAMKERRWGRIVNISSGAGRTVSLTGIQAYASAKAAQIGFTRQMAHELGPFGITVNCIAPGFILSNPTTRPAVGKLRFGWAGERWCRASPCGGWGHPRTSPTEYSSSSRNGPPGSPGRRSRSTAAMLSFDSGDAAYLAELAEFVAVPSISRDASDGTMQAAAQWLAGQLGFAGGRVVPAGGHPVVLGEWSGAAGAPTVLVYGHYDVQPTGSEAEWVTPPFELTVDGGIARGRGASDDKGPVYLVLKTAQAFMAQEGRLPLNVKFLFEGEEEIGSPHLPAFVAEHAAGTGRRPGHLRRRGDVAAGRALGRGEVQGPGRDGHHRRGGQHGPALRPVRRNRRQSPARAGRHPGQPAPTRTGRSPSPASTTAFPGWARSAAANSRRSPSMNRAISRNWDWPSRTASRGSPRWSACGSGPRWRSTACAAAGSTP